MTTAPPGVLRLKVLDVGQGDAIVLFLPDSRRALVVDAYDGERVLRALEGDAVEEVILFLSHSDHDHVAGVEYLLNNFQGDFKGFFYNRDRLKASPQAEYRASLRALAAATRSLTIPFSHDFNTNLNEHARFEDIASPPVSLEVLHPTHDEQSSFIGTTTNEAAGVLRVVYTDTNGNSWAILLAADVQLTGISCMMHRFRADPSKLRANVLKYPHHGAWPNKYLAIQQFPGLERQSMTSFLQAVDPEFVVLSVGMGNRDEHVRSEVFTTLRELAQRKLRMRRITCTQFTQTCLRHGDVCDPPQCAGDIEIRIGDGVPDGIEVLPSSLEHVVRILEVTDREHAGCGPLLPH